jgi:hypothetical protein
MYAGEAKRLNIKSRELRFFNRGQLFLFQKLSCGRMLASTVSSWPSRVAEP